jgi:hypothetical protein
MSKKISEEKEIQWDRRSQTLSAPVKQQMSTSRLSENDRDMKVMSCEITLSQSAVVRAVMPSRSTRVNTALETLPEELSSAFSKIGRIDDNMWAGSSILERANRPMASKRVGAGALAANNSEA